MRKKYVQTNNRAKALKICPRAMYIVKAVEGHWCFDSYEAWAEYEFN